MTLPTNTDPATVEPEAPQRPDAISGDVRELITDAVGRHGNVVVITGAGVSAESGIRTYRGANGMWTDGGQEAMLKATGAEDLLRVP